MISDNMFPRFKSFEQLLKDTNNIFKWDRVAKENYAILYEKGIDYAKQRKYKEAGESFYKAASLAEKKKRMEDAYKLFYCTWECALWYGNPEPLAMYTKEIYDIYNQKFPEWLIERLGVCGIAHVEYADLVKDKNESDMYIKLGGWLLTQYFDNTGDFKDFENEWVLYIFYGYCCEKVGGRQAFSEYACKLRKHVPEQYVVKVDKGWNMLIKT